MKKKNFDNLKMYIADEDENYLTQGIVCEIKNTIYSGNHELLYVIQFDEHNSYFYNADSFVAMKENLRIITLALNFKDCTEEQIENLNNFCKQNNFKVSALYTGTNNRYEFKLFGDTNNFNKLNNYFNGKLIELRYAKLGNTFNLSHEEFTKWTKVLDELLSRCTRIDTFHDDFFHSVMNVESVEFLESLKEFSMPNEFDDLLQSRIEYKKGIDGAHEKYMYKLLEKQEMVKKIEEIKESGGTFTKQDLNNIISLLK